MERVATKARRECRERAPACLGGVACKLLSKRCSYSRATRFGRPRTLGRGLFPKRELDAGEDGLEAAKRGDSSSTRPRVGLRPGRWVSVMHWRLPVRRMAVHRDPVRMVSGMARVLVPEAMGSRP